MRKTFTDKGVEKLKVRAKEYSSPDPELRGHYVRVQPSGTKSFAVAARDPNGKQKWATIGSADVLSIDEARKRARPALDRIQSGQPAFEAPAESFEAVVANWRKRHVERNGLRSQNEINRLLDRHVLPVWGKREFTAIKRSDIAALLDGVEDAHGARQADYCLNIIRSIMNWFSARNDGYNPPVVKGMRRQSPHAQARARVLTDDEIRAIWKAAESIGTFGGIIRLCLLTAQRSRKVAAMKWADISDAGEWTIPKEAREKDTGGVLVLPDTALAIIRAQYQLGSNPYVFGSRGDGPYRGFSAGKVTLDAKLPAGTPSWVVHDLRRTARSLMSRASVYSEHAERVMGHALPGVEGVYDRYAYCGEKGEALRKLAALIDSIIDPRPNVISIAKAKRPKRR